MSFTIKTIRSSSPSSVFFSPFQQHLPSLCKKISGLSFKRQNMKSAPRPEETDLHDVTTPDKAAQGGENKKLITRDVLAESFGEGYTTRCDEEGFGGIYGGNQSMKVAHHEEIHEEHPEFDKAQGSEVVEKEKARNQTGASEVEATVWIHKKG